MPDIFGYTEEKWRAEKYHYLWNITKKEILIEIPRQGADKASFVYVLNWV
jgi:hypothetical protein